MDSKHLSKPNLQSSEKEKNEILPPSRGELEGGYATPTSFQKKIAILFLIVSLLGFIDATYLTIKHFSGEAITCSLTNGCDAVTNSVYSEIFGIPLALAGALYYLLIFLLAIYYFDTKKQIILKNISFLTPIGLIASAYFTYIQAFILHAWCQYCIGSAITSSLLFLTGMIYLYLLRPSAKKTLDASVPPS